MDRISAAKVRSLLAKFGGPEPVGRLLGFLQRQGSALQFHDGLDQQRSVLFRG